MKNKIIYLITLLLTLQISFSIASDGYSLPIIVEGSIPTKGISSISSCEPCQYSKCSKTYYNKGIDVRFNDDWYLAVCDGACSNGGCMSPDYYPRLYNWGTTDTGQQINCPEGYQKVKVMKKDCDVTKYGENCYDNLCKLKSGIFNIPLYPENDPFELPSLITLPIDEEKCRYGDKRCSFDEQSVEKCNYYGKWEKIYDCEFGRCKDGECGSPVIEPTKCTNGDRRCTFDKKYVEECNSDGLWEKLEACMYNNCENGECLLPGPNLCNSGDRRCSSDGRYVQECNTSGTAWVNIDECDNGSCVNAVCNSAPSRLCTPGEERCSEDQSRVEKCNSSGSQWEKIEDCKNNRCKNAKCSIFPIYFPNEPEKGKVIQGAGYNYFETITIDAGGVDSIVDRDGRYFYYQSFMNFNDVQYPTNVNSDPFYFQIIETDANGNFIRVLLENKFTGRDIPNTNSATEIRKLNGTAIPNNIYDTVKYYKCRIYYKPQYNIKPTQRFNFYINY